MPRGTGFVWTALREARLRNEVKTFNQNITRLANKYGWTPGAELPYYQNVEDVRSHINDANDFRRIIGYKSDEKNRPSQLQRFRASVRPENQKLNPQTGQVNWIDNEIRYAERKATQVRRKAAAEVEKLKQAEAAKVDVTKIDHWGIPKTDYTPPTEHEQIMDMLNGNVAEQYGTYTDYEDLEDLWEQVASEHTVKYVNNYLDALDEHMTDIYVKVSRIIRELMKLDPTGLKALFDYGYDELQIDYIYVTEKSVYKGIPFETRQRNVLEFWEEHEW